MNEHSTALVAIDQDDASIVERAIVSGDLERLSSADRTAYYVRLCQSLGLNPLTRPFEYVKLSGKLVLYARRDCTDQLRDLHDVSVQFIDRRRTDDDLYIVTARATKKGGRTDESTGAVAIQGLRGEALANALMKAETKAKRRVTLSICGLGWLDETEVTDVPDARPVEARQIEPREEPRKVPDAKTLAERALTATTLDAAIEVLRAASAMPRVRAHAYKRLVELSPDLAQLSVFVTNVQSDTGLPDEIRAKLLVMADERRAALEDREIAAEDAQQPAA